MKYRYLLPICAALSAAVVLGLPWNAAVAASAGDECDRLVKTPGDYDRPPRQNASPGSMARSEAAEACRKAVAEYPENPRYMLQLAFALLYPTALYFPDRTNTPPQEAWKYLSLAADAEYPGAVFFMARMMETGHFPGLQNPGVAWRLALSQYRKAAKLGNPAAMLRLASEYSTIGGGLLRGTTHPNPREDLVQAMDWAKQAIAAGHPRGEIVFARIVLEASAAKPAEREEAKEMLKRRMDSGDCDAFWAMGVAILFRENTRPHGGTQSASPEGLRLVRIAADGGQYAAQRMMARFYGPKSVFKPDPGMAEHWSDRAKKVKATGRLHGKNCKG